MTEMLPVARVYLLRSAAPRLIASLTSSSANSSAAQVGRQSSISKCACMRTHPTSRSYTARETATPAQVLPWVRSVTPARTSRSSSATPAGWLTACNSISLSKLASRQRQQPRPQVQPLQLQLLRAPRQLRLRQQLHPQRHLLPCPPPGPCHCPLSLTCAAPCAIT